MPHGEKTTPTGQLRATLYALVLLYGASIAAIHHVYLTHTASDLTILNRIHSHANPTLTLLAGALSFVGSPHTLWPAVILIAAVLWHRRLRPQATALLLTMSLSGLLETLVKLAVRRPRPALPWAYVHENSFSFPSGHATLAIALYGSLIYLTRHRLPVQRLTTLIVAVAMTVAIGLSRLYLGAHNPTDVLAGYLTGAVCLLAIILASQIRQYRPPG